MTKFLLALLMFATSALAADFTGTWSGEAVTNGESHAIYFVLKQEGGKLTGTGGPNAGEQHQFVSAKLDGSKLVLDIEAGENATIHFELEGDGANLKGSVVLKKEDGTETGPVTLKKITS